MDDRPHTTFPDDDHAPEHTAWRTANAALEALREETRRLQERLDQVKRCLEGCQALVEAIPGRPCSGRDEDRLRRGSAVRLAYRVLHESGRPLHVREILSRMGPRGERTSTSLTSSLARYAKAGRYFVRTGQGVYGLLVEPSTLASTGRERPG